MPNWKIDHLVIAADDLDSGCDHVERLLGERPVIGGRHPGWGTHNSVMTLGPWTYLEVISLDPTLQAPPGPVPFGLDRSDLPAMTTWACSGIPLDQLPGLTADLAHPIPPPCPMSRVRPDGSVLSWTLTDPACMFHGGLVPFFIDWGSDPHPAGSMPGSCTLRELLLETPDPAGLEDHLRLLGIGIDVRHGSSTRMIAIVDTPSGSVELS